MSYLRQSKIVVCAWGFGERTGCEHGGWVHGALVVKPESDWVLSLPDMYRSNATYVAVKADWSDLPTTLRHVLANYDGYSDEQHRKLSLGLVGFPTLLRSYSFLTPRGPSSLPQDTKACAPMRARRSFEMPRIRSSWTISGGLVLFSRISTPKLPKSSKCYTKVSRKPFMSVEA